MAQLQPIIVFHGRNFLRHLGICNPICVKLLWIVFGVIPRNLKKDISISNHFPGVYKRGIHTDTHTDTHDDSIQQNAMRCISPKNALTDFKTRYTIRFRKCSINNIYVHNRNSKGWVSSPCSLHGEV